MKSPLKISLRKQAPISEMAIPYMTNKKSKFTYMKLFNKYGLIIFSMLLLLCISSCSTNDVATGLATELGIFNVPAKQITSAPFELIPPTSSRLGSFSYQSSDPSVAVIKGSTLTIVGIGTATITATQSDYKKYSEVSTTAEFRVTELEPPTLGAFTIPTKIIGEASFQLTPPSSNSTGAFTYTSSNPSVATISGSTVTILAIGTTTITATQVPQSPYATAFISANFNVENKPALLQENFEYAGAFGAPVLTDITSSGWTIHSGTSNPIQTTSTSSLSFANYYGNGLGLAAVLNATGIDINKQFAQQSEGTPIYMSFVVKVKTPTSTALIPLTSYFFHTSSVPFVSGSSSTFRGQVFSQPITGDLTQYNLGLSFFGSASPQATNTTKLNYEQNYLVVLKYNRVIGANNDTASLYVFSASDNFSTEPSQAFIGPLSLPSATDISPAAVCLRQFDGNQNIYVDAIRVSTIWDLSIN